MLESRPSPQPPPPPEAGERPMNERRRTRTRGDGLRAGAGYKPKTMATRFLAPSMRQVVHPVRRLPRHSTRMLQEGKMEGGGERMVNSIPIHDAANPAIAPVKHLAYLWIYEQSEVEDQWCVRELIFGFDRKWSVKKR